MISIEQTLNSFLNLEQGREGGPNSRYLSWKYCHDVFAEVHKNLLNLDQRRLADEDGDLLSLHLAFYLASWGMYRGSSFLLQRDYKAHRKVIEILMRSSYDSLWDFDPCRKPNEELDAAADLILDIYDLIKREGYGEIPEQTNLEGAEDAIHGPTETLITKILMGTLACVPAFDRYLIEGMKCYNRAHGNELGRGSAFSKEKILALFHFAQTHVEELCVAGNDYPPMKRVDMYFWEVGYEHGFLEALENEKEKLEELKTDSFEDVRKKKKYERTLAQIKVFLPDGSFGGDHHRGVIEGLLRAIRERVL